MRLPEVQSIVGKSKSSIYADPTFPKPIKIGPRASAWIEAEILAWIDARIEPPVKGPDSGRRVDRRSWARNLVRSADSAIADLLSTAPSSARGIVGKAFEGTCSPRAAIKAHCLVCVDYDRSAIRDCRVSPVPPMEVPAVPGSAADPAPDRRDGLCGRRVRKPAADPARPVSGQIPRARHRPVRWQDAKDLSSSSKLSNRDRRWVSGSSGPIGLGPWSVPGARGDSSSARRVSLFRTLAGSLRFGRVPIEFLCATYRLRSADPCSDGHARLPSTTVTRVPHVLRR